MEQPMSGTPESFGESLLRETRDLARGLDRTLRGHNGHIGLVAKVERLEERVAELFDDKAATHRLKLYTGKAEEAKWKAIALWGGAFSGFGTLLYEIWTKLTGG